MFQSVVVYTFTALILYVFAVNVSRRDKIYHKETGKILSLTSWEILLSFVVFCFIAGARYNVGVDHLSYLGEYESYLKRGYLTKDTYEIGFELITRAFAYFSLHYYFYFAFWAFVQIFFIYKSFEDEKYLLPYIVLCIMLGPYFLDWMNGIRQCVVICFFVYAVRFIEEKKLLPYVMGVMLMSLIHRSAVMLLPFVLLAYKPIALKNRRVNYSILLASIILGLVPTWINLMSNVANLLSIMGYDTYSERFTDIIDTEHFRATAWGPSRLSLLCVDVIIVYYYPKVRCFLDKTKKIDILFFIFFLGTCFYNLFLNTSHIFLRPIGYLTIMKLPLTAYTLYYLKKTKNMICYSTMCTLLFSYIYFIIYKSVHMPTLLSETNLYKFFFFETNQY